MQTYEILKLFMVLGDHFFFLRKVLGDHVYEYIA
jgi:hypothetical protein